MWNKSFDEKNINSCGYEYVIIHNKKYKTEKILKMFYSIREAERKTGVNNRNICSCCKGRQKSAGGYRWKYVD